MKKGKAHKSVKKEPIVHNKPIEHHKSKSKNSLIIIGIIVLIVLIIGAVIATIILTKSDPIVPIENTDINTTDTNNSIIDNNDISLEEFQTKYLELMSKNQELSNKMRPEFSEALKTLQKPIFDEITQKLNLNKSEIDSCLEENDEFSETFNAENASIIERISYDTQYGQMLGITGTPTIIVNGTPVGGYVPYADLKAAIEEALDGNVTVDEMFDENDTYFGNKDAKVVVYIYSDYYCSYCKQLAEESLNLLKTEYINTNKIKFVPKDFIRAEPSAAIYARCAQEQNKYFEAELELFNNSSALSNNLQLTETAVMEKYSAEINEFQEDVAILQKWAEEHPDEFKQFQESFNAEAQ